MIEKINNFMNDPDRGAGHGIAQGLVYGIALLPLATLGWQACVLGCAINHLRVLYQELINEDWKSKPKTGDFWFDAVFRPLQSDAVLLFGFMPQYMWLVISVFIVLLGIKKKNDWPLLIFWK